MLFGEKLKVERERQGWSQNELAEKLFVSRQSVSKWETNKNYPTIEVIISLSDLLDITIDELLRSDEGLKTKVIKDSQSSKSSTWKTSFWTLLGITVGIMVASFIKNDGFDWLAISWTTIMTLAFLYLVSLLFPQWSKKDEAK